MMDDWSINQSSFSWAGSRRIGRREKKKYSFIFMLIRAKYSTWIIQNITTCFSRQRSDVSNSLMLLSMFVSFSCFHIMHMKFQYPFSARNSFSLLLNLHERDQLMFTSVIPDVLHSNRWADWDQTLSVGSSRKRQTIFFVEWLSELSICLVVWPIFAYNRLCLLCT